MNHSSRKLLRQATPLVNLEIGLVGLLSGLLILLINWWGTGYVAWHAALVRVGVSTLFHLLVPKWAEAAARAARTPLRAQLWGNLVPNTVANAVQFPLFLWLGIPRPWLSVWPFWLVGSITFTQVVKLSRRGYEPGVLDILHWLREELRRLGRMIAK